LLETRHWFLPGHPSCRGPLAAVTPSGQHPNVVDAHALATCAVSLNGKEKCGDGAIVLKRS